MAPAFLIIIPDFFEKTLTIGNKSFIILYGIMQKWAFRPENAAFYFDSEE